MSWPPRRRRFRSKAIANHCLTAPPCFFVLVDSYLTPLRAQTALLLAVVLVPRGRESALRWEKGKWEEPCQAARKISGGLLLVHAKMAKRLQAAKPRVEPQTRGELSAQPCCQQEIQQSASCSLQVQDASLHYTVRCRRGAVTGE